MITRRKFIVRCLNTGIALSLTQRTSLLSEWVDWRAKPLRVGIIGLGAAGLSNLDRCLATEQVTVSALCDLSTKALGIAAARFSETVPAFHDYRALLDRPDVHAVTVAVPANERAAIVTEACRAGKHVYLEPPWAPTISASEELLRVARTGAALVYQDRIDDGWDTDSLHDFIRDNRGAPSAMHLTLYRARAGAASGETLIDALDQMRLAQKLLGTSLPTTVSAVQGLNAAYGLTGLNAAVRFHFKNAGGQESKSLIVQMVYASGASDKLMAHIATAHSNGSHFEYVVELSQNDATVSQSGWRRFLTTLREQPSTWISIAENNHYSNSYVLLGEQALKTGSWRRANE